MKGALYHLLIKYAAIWVGFVPVAKNRAASQQPWARGVRQFLIFEYLTIFVLIAKFLH